MTDSARVELRGVINTVRDRLVGEVARACDAIAFGSDWSAERLHRLAEVCQSMTVKFEELEPSELDDAELREMAFALPLTSGTVRRRVDEFTRADEHP